MNTRAVILGSYTLGWVCLFSCTSDNRAVGGGSGGGSGGSEPTAKGVPTLTAGAGGSVGATTEMAGQGGGSNNSAAGSGGGNPTDRNFATDRDQFLGASRCADANVELCEDFESGSLNSEIWEINGSKPTIDEGQHARGSKALHIRKDGNGASGIRQKKTFPAKDNRYYGRIFVYFERLPPSSMGYSHWTLLAASGNKVRGEIRLGGQLQRGNNRFGVGTDSYGDPNGTDDWINEDKDEGQKPVPEKEWMCIEWLHDGKENETRFWWDAIEHSSVGTTASNHGGNDKPFLLPEFTNVWVGWDEYQETNERFELWIDEIAIDHERIGCIL